MSLNFGARSLGDLRLLPPRGIAGLGFSRLQFALEIHLGGHPAPAVILEQLVASVAAGPPGGSYKPLGRAQPQSSWSTFTLEHHRTECITLELDLTRERLEALERLRAGQAIAFQFDLSLQLHRIAPAPQQPRYEVQPGFERASLLVSASDWIAVLKDLGYLDCLILEVELPLEMPQELHHTVGEIHAAHADLIAGRYDATVMRCRRAMESVGALTPAEAPQGKIWVLLAQGKDRREAMTKPERAELVRQAVRHFSHLAAHVDERGAPEVFSRQDALFILTAAAAVIWEAAARTAAGEEPRG